MKIDTKILLTIITLVCIPFHIVSLPLILWIGYGIYKLDQNS